MKWVLSVSSTASVALQVRSEFKGHRLSAAEVFTCSWAAESKLTSPIRCTFGWQPKASSPWDLQDGLEMDTHPHWWFSESESDQNQVFWPSKFAQTRNLTWWSKVALNVLTQNIHYNTHTEGERTVSLQLSEFNSDQQWKQSIWIWGSFVNGPDILWSIEQAVLFLNRIDYQIRTKCCFCLCLR